MTIPTIRQRVRAGAEFLDARVPGWFGQIDLAVLDLESECRCVLGQLWFDKAVSSPDAYSEAVHELGLDGLSELGWHTWCRDEAFGFDICGLYGEMDSDQEYRLLTAEWRAAVEARRA